MPYKSKSQEHILASHEDRRRHPVGSFGPIHPVVPFADIRENHRETRRSWSCLPCTENWCPEDTMVLFYQTRENKNFTFTPSFPHRSNISGCHSYPLLSKKNWRGVYKNDSSSSNALQPHFILISSRIPAYEVQCVRRPALLWIGFFLIFPRIDVWQSFGHHVYENDSSPKRKAVWSKWKCTDPNSFKNQKQ